MSRTVSAAAYESLMQFLYRAPIGLVQTTLGAVEMIDPSSARLLMPLSNDGSLDNLFDVLEGVAPQLRSQAQAAQREGDVVCDALRVTFIPHSRSRFSITTSTLDRIAFEKTDIENVLAKMNDAQLNKLSFGAVEVDANAGVEEGKFSKLFEYVFDNQMNPTKVKVHMENAISGGSFWIFVMRL